jgi:ribosomal protein S18 acetylase RimI-like enzyme
MAPEPDVVIRAGDLERDAEGLRSLWGLAFGRSREPASFDWKYRQNPAGAAEISVAESEGEIVSVACALPLRMRVGSEAARGALSVDVATRPELRGRGVYGRVARNLWARLAERGFALTCGFTNRFSTRLTLQALGRREVGPLPLRVRPLAPLRLGLDWLRLGAPSHDPGPAPAPRGEIHVLDGFDERFDATWARLEPHVDVAVVRDAAYLGWRYGAHPERPYETLGLVRGSEVLGYLIWRPLDRFGTRTAFVVDLAAAPEDARAASALLAAAAERARERGARLLALLSWPGAPTHASACRFAPLRVPPRLFPQVNVFSAISHRAEPSTAGLAEPARWWIGWGDSDVV